MRAFFEGEDNYQIDELRSIITEAFNLSNLSELRALCRQELSIARPDIMDRGLEKYEWIEALLTASSSLPKLFPLIHRLPIGILPDELFLRVLPYSMVVPMPSGYILGKGVVENCLCARSCNPGLRLNLAYASFDRKQREALKCYIELHVLHGADCAADSMRCLAHYESLITDESEFKK